MKGYKAEGTEPKSFKPKVRNPYLDEVLRILPAVPSHFVTNMTVEKPLTARVASSHRRAHLKYSIESLPEVPATAGQTKSTSVSAQYEELSPFAFWPTRPSHRAGDKSVFSSVEGAQECYLPSKVRELSNPVVDDQVIIPMQPTKPTSAATEQSARTHGKVARRDSGYLPEPPMSARMPEQDKPKTSFTRQLINTSDLRRISEGEYEMNRRLSTAERLAKVMAEQAGQYSAEELSGGFSLSKSDSLNSEINSQQASMGRERKRTQQFIEL